MNLPNRITLSRIFLIPVFIVVFFLDVRRIKRGYYEAEFVRLHESPQSLPDFELTALYFKHLEQTIMRQPELYLWTHKRFRNAEVLGT